MVTVPDFNLEILGLIPWRKRVAQLAQVFVPDPPSCVSWHAPKFVRMLKIPLYVGVKWTDTMSFTSLPVAHIGLIQLKTPFVGAGHYN